MANALAVLKCRFRAPAVASLGACCRVPTPWLCLLRWAPASLLPSAPSRSPGRSTRHTGGSTGLSPCLLTEGGHSTLPGCGRPRLRICPPDAASAPSTPAAPGARVSVTFFPAGGLLSRPPAARVQGPAPSRGPWYHAPLPPPAPGNPVASCRRIAPEVATL
ncbi:uncharacterized protein ACBT57_023857 [Dama dama]